MRLRIAWGGGAERRWQGAVALSEGTLAEPRLLGIEADEPGSMWLEAGRLVIRQRSPRTYDGVDLLVTAPPEANLLVRLSASDDPVQPDWVAIPLADLVGGFYSADLDDRANRLLVRRTPGDTLQVEMSRRSLVFAPGELLQFKLTPHRLPLKRDTKLRINVQLLGGRNGRELWSAEHAVVVGQPLPIPLEVRLPDQEGVYEVAITAALAPGLRLPQLGRPRLSWNQTVAKRKIQVLVLSPERPVVPVGLGSPLSLVEEIDPVNPKWWERFAKLPQLPRLKRLWKGPLGNGRLGTLEHPLGPLVRLGPSADSADVSWEAYTLPIKRPGQPHVLEVDYPSDVPQTMGISIIEPNAAGAVFPIGLDTGVEVTEQVTGDKQSSRWLRHRVIFWPRTKAPMVLITNRRDGSPAVYGKIRVLDGWQRLPRAFPPGGPSPERLLAAYLDRPLIAENFSASEVIGSLSDLGVDDWVTFFEGGTRLVEYLNYVGFGGLMISALADGSTIYPSALVEPTPRYDTGVFLDLAQDPVRKDVLEMLFRMFDREDLKLIPALEFGAPLPELEAVLRRGGPESEGIEWIGPEGTPWLGTYRPVRGMAPYYNVLHPRVQEAMIAVVRELVGLYGHHGSFAGLAIHLSAHGYAQLPGPDWGLDDATIARFEQDMNVRIPGTGPQRFTERARFLASEFPHEWIQWRADQLNRFYRRIRAELTAIRPEGRLYLAGANMLAGEELEHDLAPALPRRMTISEAMLRVGIDVRHYSEDEAIVLLRPERIAPQGSLVRQAVDLEIRQMPDRDRCFQGLSVPGSLFFHQPQEVRVASFDEKSPFQPSYTWLASQPVPSGAQNRRRFVHGLATLDSQAIFDGGWLLPLGQEDAVRDLVAVYRRLPAIRFQRLSDQPDSNPSQPVTIRYGSQADGTYVYLVNDAPFATTVRVEVAAPTGCKLEELSGLRQVAPLRRDADGAYWTVDLEPYDLVAVRLSAPEVKLSGPQVSWSGAVQEALETRIAHLQDRAAALRNPPILEALENPDFEDPPTTDGRIPGWVMSGQVDATIGLDGNLRRGGAQALRMASRESVASLASQPFDPPDTGRLTVRAWLRVADGARQPPLRLAVEGKLKTGEVFCFAQVGPTDHPATDVPQLGTEWQYRDVEVRNLPLERLSKLRVRFDLMGTGEVWIDDVTLCKLAFSKKERVELFKLIAPADYKLSRGEVGDCIQLLEGYWPRFLAANVPLAEVPVSRKPDLTQPPPQRPQQPEQSTGFLDRVKGLLPRKLPFY